MGHEAVVSAYSHILLTSFAPGLEGAIDTSSCRGMTRRGPAGSVFSIPAQAAAS
jgi:hypothetical protein